MSPGAAVAEAWDAVDCEGIKNENWPYEILVKQLTNINVVVKTERFIIDGFLPTLYPVFSDPGIFTQDRSRCIIKKREFSRF